ncbi:unnamed protein product, partial [marine sediment metagenome]
MAGKYTDIVDIVAPSSAVAGETVPVTVRVKNIHTYGFRISVAVTYVPDGLRPVRFIGPEDKWVAAGATESWSGSFTMPSNNVTIWAYSSYWGEDQLWHLDDEMSKNVSLAAPVTFHLSVNVPSWAAGGHIDPGSGDYPAYSTVTLTAYPLSGYQFLGWGGDA